MRSALTESEIAEVFDRLKIASPEDRQRVLMPSLVELPVANLKDIKFDIGFNAKLPGR